MANVLEVKMRDFGRDIEADDPLMELSRIMGFDKPRAANDRADPQIAIEDTFSMDLERELALEELPSEAPSQIDAEFNAAFEDELSDAIQFGEDAPSVVPSLEDELSALLGEGPQALPEAVPETVPAVKAFEPARPVRDWEPPATPAHAEPDNSWLEEDLVLAEANVESPSALDADLAENASAAPAGDIAGFDNSWLDEELDAQPVSAAAPDFAPAQNQESQIQAFRLSAPVDNEAGLDGSWLEDELDISASDAGAAAPAVDAAAGGQGDEPWLDIDFDEQPATAGQDEAGFEPALEIAPAVDPVLAQMSRATPVSHWPAKAETDDSALDAMEFDLAIEDSAPSVEPEYETDEAVNSIPPAPEFDAWRPAGALDDGAKAGFSGGFGRLLAETAPEPVVEASEPMRDAVAQTDDFEIPDFDFSPEPKSAAASPASISAMAEYEPYAGYEPKVERAPAPMSGESDFDFEGLLDEELVADNGGSAPAYGAAAAGLAAAATIRPKANERVDADLDFQPFGEAPEFPEANYAAAEPRRKGWIVPALLAGAALLGGGIYYAYSGGHAATAVGGPALVKADPQPVKIAPENPGGKTVPDQDKAVYNKVDGEKTAMPTQGTLVSESEEPVDIASVAADDAGAETSAVSAKSEARVDAAADSSAIGAAPAETSAVSPKKVRTFIVKPDGTLVERPAEAAAPAAKAEVPAAVAADQPVSVPAAKPVEAAKLVEAAKPIEAAKTAVPVKLAEAAKPAVAKPAAVKPVAVAKPAAEVKPAAAAVAAADAPAASQAPAKDMIAKLAAAEPVAQGNVETAAATPAPAIKIVKTKKIKAPAAETVASATAADGAPLLESRPADQPVTIVGKTGGKKAAANAPAGEVQVAAADSAPAASTGGYAIQIASTPSPEAAKSTYAALNRKFLSVIGGRGVNIQKADVAGKGTVYRVRIPAGSKQEAAALCSQYKASGGSCFVTK